MDYSIIKERANCVAPTNERITKMSKDEKEMELLSSISTGNFTKDEINLWTEQDSKKVLQEVKFDNWNNDFNSVDTVTINTSEYLSPHGTDTITVNTADIEAGSNGTFQGDLFNGWPEDGEPQIVTVTLDDIKDD